jgi:hypothetical protein
MVLLDWPISPNALVYIFHGVLICVGIHIQGPEDSLHHDGKNGAVELALSWLNNTEFKPMGYVFLYLFTMHIRDFELFNVDGFLSFEGNFLLQSIVLPEVKLVLADHFIIFEDDVQVLLTKFQGYIKA